MKIKQYKARVINFDGTKSDEWVTGGLMRLFSQEKDGERRLIERWFCLWERQNMPTMSEVDIRTVKEAESIEPVEVKDESN